VKTAQVQSTWIDNLMDMHRERGRLAGVRAWQEAVMDAMQAAGPEARNRFVNYLQQHGHLNMVAVEPR
jgi:hypothetical protein